MGSMSSPRLAFSALLALVLLASPVTARGQDGAADPQAEARRLFEEGRAHADAERWAAAVASF